MKIIDIEGIGPAYAAKLTKAGVRSVEGLLKKGASDKGRKEIAAASGIEHTLILGWVNRADLYRIKGVGAQYSDLLEKAGQLLDIDQPGLRPLVHRLCAG